MPNDAPPGAGLRPRARRSFPSRRTPGKAALETAPGRFPAAYGVVTVMRDGAVLVRAPAVPVTVMAWVFPGVACAPTPIVRVEFAQLCSELGAGWTTGHGC